MVVELEMQLSSSARGRLYQKNYFFFEEKEEGKKKKFNDSIYHERNRGHRPSPPIHRNVVVMEGQWSSATSSRAKSSQIIA
jgi:hypothetical protein